MSYKRRELKVHNDGYTALAKAVLRQWVTDGRPVGDTKAITIWSTILKDQLDRPIKHSAVRRGEVHYE